MPTLPMGYVLQERYHLQRKLATGGFGSVYIAEDVRLRGRKVAVKELSDVSAASRQLFQQEACVLAALDHSGLVHVSDFFEEGRSVYLVMDYIEGQDLLELASQAQDEHRLLPYEQVLQWMIQVFEAVAYLHRHTPPIIHRDIKPNNIRLDITGRAILVDFGIAKVGARSKTQRMAEAVSKGFSPPEQYLSGMRTDTRSDVYALGATFYCLLTVSLPPDSLQRYTQQNPLPSVCKKNSEVDHEVQNIIRKAMALQPEQRFEDAGDLLIGAQQALGLSTSSLPPKPPPEQQLASPGSKLRSKSTPLSVVRALCPHCGQPARSGARFCSKCGILIQIGPRCPNCGADNRSGARFCAHCRAPLGGQHATPPPISSERYIEEGDRRREAGQFQSAIAAYESALRLGAKDTTLCEHLAHCYLEAKRYPQAISFLKTAICRYDNHPKFYIQLAMAYLNNGNAQEGLQAMQRAQQLVPQDAEMAYTLANLYMELNEHEQALPIWENLSRQYSQRSELRVQLAICCIMTGRLQKAASLVKDLQRKLPKSAEVTFLCGMISFKEERWRQALRYFQTAVQQDPNCALAYYFIGEVYFRRRQWQRALQAYQNSTQANPNDADVWAAICLCYLALGQTTEARNALHRALCIDSHNPLVRRIQRESKL